MRKGIPQIKIPIRPSELTIEAVEPYLDSVFAQFMANATKITKDYDVYCLDHKIHLKVRAHQDTDINNIVLVPDLKAMVDWKTGYTYGNPIKYAQSKTNETDDINYLNKYVRSACQRSVDKEVGKWAFATGVGYYFIEPKSTDFDVETEAPYIVYHRTSDTCTKVYSAFDNNMPLFDILYTTYKVIEKGQEREVKVLDIYFPENLYTYENEIGRGWVNKKTQSRGFAKPLPLVEKRFNSDGIGIIAMGETLQYAVDTLLSNGLDNVEDIVNEIFVYKNVNLGNTPEEQADKHRRMKKSGALVLNGGSKEMPPDVDTISTKLSLSEVRELFSIIDAKFHSSLGIPMEMSNTNSGGTTKSGSEVANGYDNAYNRALDDINTMIVADTELLNKIMWICKNTKGNKINNLAPSEIEIKYSLNLTDNILTKTQSYVNLVQVGVPHTIALRLCKLSNDPEAEGKIIEEYAKKKVQEAQKAFEQTSKDEKTEDTPTVNNSQE